MHPDQSDNCKMSNPAREKQSSLRFIPLGSLDAALFAVGTATAHSQLCNSRPVSDGGKPSPGADLLHEQVKHQAPLHQAGERLPAERKYDMTWQIPNNRHLSRTSKATSKIFGAEMFGITRVDPLVARCTCVTH